MSEMETDGYFPHPDDETLGRTNAGKILRGRGGNLPVCATRERAGMVLKMRPVLAWEKSARN
jgi:hypothetical protein